MIAYPHINPEIVRIGPVAIRWYGLMYAAGFASSYALVKYQLKKIRQGSAAAGKGKGRNAATKEIPGEFLDALYTYLIVGLILGARLGYVLFYDLSSYIRNPLEILAVWHGGMSFHGGMIGSLLAGYLCCRKYRVDFWQVADLVVVTAPIGLGLGRLGNFINGELFGRTTNVPWAMVFPQGGPLPRHPSQLYEFALEGILLFTILWLLKNRKHAPGTMVAACLMLYGLFRIIAEFFRQPDAQLGFIMGPFTMGQILSALTILGGIVLYVFRKRAVVS
ncbi:MAG TPA: prolipoprotein diacylglyceryl transferase [Nitrospirota bacterium]|nr:prolipoprotein diacylglyceryl transferase [Nitrospirota bacterium]